MQTRSNARRVSVATSDQHDSEDVTITRRQTRSSTKMADSAPELDLEDEDKPAAIKKATKAKPAPKTTKQASRTRSGSHKTKMGDSNHEDDTNDNNNHEEDDEEQVEVLTSVPAGRRSTRQTAFPEDSLTQSSDSIKESTKKKDVDYFAATGSESETKISPTVRPTRGRLSKAQQSSKIKDVALNHESVPHSSFQDFSPLNEKVTNLKNECEQLSDQRNTALTSINSIINQLNNDNIFNGTNVEIKPTIAPSLHRPESRPNLELPETFKQTADLCTNNKSHSELVSQVLNKLEAFPSTAADLSCEHILTICQQMSNQHRDGQMAVDDLHSNLKIIIRIINGTLSTLSKPSVCPQSDFSPQLLTERRKAHDSFSSLLQNCQQLLQ